MTHSPEHSNQEWVNWSRSVNDEGIGRTHCIVKLIHCLREFKNKLENVDVSVKLDQMTSMLEGFAQTLRLTTRNKEPKKNVKAEEVKKCKHKVKYEMKYRSCSNGTDGDAFESKSSDSSVEGKTS